MLNLLLFARSLSNREQWEQAVEKSYAEFEQQFPTDDPWLKEREREFKEQLMALDPDKPIDKVIEGKARRA